MLTPSVLPLQLLYLSSDYTGIMYQKLETGLLLYVLKFWYGHYPPPRHPYSQTPHRPYPYRKPRYPRNDPWHYLLLGAIACFAVLYLLGVIQT